MNAYSSDTGTYIKSHLLRALLGGFAGTLAFTLMGKFIAPLMIGRAMDVAAILAPLFNGSHLDGMIAHFALGTLAFPLAYLILAARRLPGPAPIRGVIFLLFVYLFAMTVVMPLIGQGLFLDSMPRAMVALMGHMVFGLILGTAVGKAE
ncbi:DUF6789 family protein [Aliamphritea hakodatensis]|uniref:DUF6789 family protein n=1 Tax=Aliamphritea hakodatensis TaxID=2895352 RepID=UPI0022FDAFD1|nr:DUF6789 family protein [Aliamphritea hakodatensis]